MKKLFVVSLVGIFGTEYLRSEPLNARPLAYGHGELKAIAPNPHVYA